MEQLRAEGEAGGRGGGFRKNEAGSPWLMLQAAE